MRKKRRKKATEAEGFVESLIVDGDMSRPRVQSDQAAEQATLGSMMADKDATLRAIGILDAEDFYSQGHQIIFAAMADLFKAGNPVDAITVSSALGSRLEECGGMSYLMRLSADAPITGAVAHYAKDIKALAIKRKQWLAIQSFAVRPDDPQLNALMEALGESAGEEITWVTADALIADDIEVEWLVEPLIPLGGVTILAADWEMGKSWVSASLCHAVANGFDNWLCSKRLPIRRKGAGVLYIDAEMGEAGMRDRIIALDKGHNIETTVVSGQGGGNGEIDWESAFEETAEKEQRPFHFAFFPALDIGPQVGALEGVIRASKAKLVVFDSMGELSPSWADPNKDGDVRKLLKPLKRLAAKLHTAILLIHHLRKPQDAGDNTPESRLLGSQAFGAGPDSAIAIVGKRDGDKAIMHMKARLTKTRMRPFRLGWHGNEQGEGVVLADDGVIEEPSHDGKLEASMDAIVNLLAQGTRTRQTLVARVVEGGAAEKRTVESALSTLKQAGKVASRLENREAVYYLP